VGEILMVTIKPKIDNRRGEIKIAGFGKRNKEMNYESRIMNYGNKI
jgi:hypothetical protein